MRKRLITSLIVVLVGLGSVLLMPSFKLVNAAVYEAFPGSVGTWRGEAGEAGKREKTVLDQATQFRKRLYRRESENFLLQEDTIDATMVLSGDDMNNSIHRPERCLRAQGYQKIRSTEVEVDIGGGKTLKVTRLQYDVPRREEKQAIGPGIMYYWFVGADHITNSHYERTFYDIKHRLVKGTNQRWAYISLNSYFGKSWQDTGRFSQAPNTAEQTDAYMQEFIRSTFFDIHKVEEIKGWKDSRPQTQKVAGR